MKIFLDQEAKGLNYQLHNQCGGQWYSWLLSSNPCRRWRWLQSVCKELHSSAPSKSPLRIERKMSSSGGTETAPWSPVLWKAPEWFFVRVDGIAPTYQPDKYAAEENTIWKDVLGKIEKKLCFWDRCGLECEHCKEDTYRFTSCTDQSRDIQGAMVYDLYILLSYILAIYYSHRRLTWSWKFEELLQENKWIHGSRNLRTWQRFNILRGAQCSRLQTPGQHLYLILLVSFSLTPVWLTQM
ncbi:uncharacterized protein LOC102552387 isoform X2 [Rattus norvegicus]|uniref:uncharacterized protein LOC102552387 isoform X2 n=1 Tax=Rattus norvegicus TaxID=10116 RepID=UPI0004E47E7B|nr:uncharacterized protein LOC102552387 isoform X2 [Rattus norvegicus]